MSVKISLENFFPKKAVMPIELWHVLHPKRQFAKMCLVIPAKWPPNKRA